MKRTGFKPRVSKLLTNADSQPKSAEVSTRVTPCYRLTRPVNFSALTTFTPAPKEPERIEHEGYRRLVAALPCSRCGIQGYSQAAHPNTGKTKGRKADDRECFPLCCDRLGVVGCHFMFDQHQLWTADVAEFFELAWGLRTRTTIEVNGEWPKNLPKWGE